MSFKNKIIPFLQSPWFLSFVLLCIFISVTGYKYGWDDQHVEIPLLKSLIDPSLYAGDYYVESLKTNFSSVFYHILAKFIRVDQIPATYLFLFIVSRYFLIFWMYKLWLYISKDKLKAFCCILVVIFIARIEEFFYRTFSHQEFALAFVFAGIYFFFKERFLLAAVILGLATNFHALYCLFPMIFMGVYLIWQVRKHGIRTLLLASGIYILCAMPFIVWTVHNHLGSYSSANPLPYQEWLQLYMQACPQNFLIPLVPFHVLKSNFGIFLTNTKIPLLIVSLLVLNLLYNKDFRQNKKALAFSLTAMALLALAFKFTYLTPNRFFLDLNLTRNMQFLMFILLGYTTILIAKTMEQRRALVGLILGLLFSLLKYFDFIATFSTVIMILFFTVIWAYDKKSVWFKSIVTLVCLGLSVPVLWGLNHCFSYIAFRYFTLVILAIITVSLLILFFICQFVTNKTALRRLKKLFYLIPLALFLLQYAMYYHERIQIEQKEAGYWLLQRSWEDMQRFVKENTPKDAMILVPYDMEMGGFRIFSERKIVASYRDCGIVGFDIKAAQEWKQRIRDIKEYKVALNGSPKEAIKNAILKYKADYIVFVRYASPTKTSSFLQRVYTNRSFVLFRVLPHRERTE